MDAGQSPRLRAPPRPSSCGTEKLPAVTIPKPATTTKPRLLSKRRTICPAAVKPGIVPNSPSRTLLSSGLSNCSTRSSSRGSTGRLKKSNTHSLLDLLNVTVHPPLVSAKAWAITDGLTGRLLYGSHEHDTREIASLTKILTCYTCLRLAKTSQAVSLDLHFRVSQRAAAMTGTRAGLLPGDEITVRNLLYGLMLPSGNDAAVCLAESIGGMLCEERGLDPSEHPPEKVYLREMNAIAQELGLSRSIFRNPTGLFINGNLSTAHDVNLLSTAAMRYGAFRTIVRSQEHCFNIKGASGCKREVRWLNTNKLLESGFDGLKTGVTPSAGPCLAASLHSTGIHLLVTVLSCKSMDVRWGEVIALVDWAQDQLQCR